MGLFQEGRCFLLRGSENGMGQRQDPHNAAKDVAGISEETHTWYGWKQLGYEVIHESKALYQAVLADPATKSGTRRTSYFGLSQMQPIGA